MFKDYHSLSLASTINLRYCDESEGNYVTNAKEIIKYLQNNLFAILDKISTFFSGVVTTL